MFTPRQEKSTLLTPFCSVIRRSSSTRVASGLFSETTTRARSGSATSFTRAWAAGPQMEKRETKKMRGKLAMLNRLNELNRVKGWKDLVFMTSNKVRLILLEN